MKIIILLYIFLIHSALIANDIFLEIGLDRKRVMSIPGAHKSEFSENIIKTKIPLLGEVFDVAITLIDDRAYVIEYSIPDISDSKRLATVFSKIRERLEMKSLKADTLVRFKGIDLIGITLLGGSDPSDQIVYVVDDGSATYSLRLLFNSNKNNKMEMYFNITSNENKSLAPM